MKELTSLQINSFIMKKTGIWDHAERWDFISRFYILVIILTD